MPYTRAYYERRREITERSAKTIIQLLSSYYSVKSVVDLGCADGTWLSIFRTFGAQNILGVDGPWVNIEQLRVPSTHYMKCDLSESMPVITQEFDLACSIEVIEHIPEESGRQLIGGLTSLAPVVLFSAAVPLQGGEGHINERRQSYWLNEFLKHGYHCFDIIRPQLWDNTAVNVIYRQNMFVYVSEKLNSFSLKFDRFKVTNSISVDVIHPDLYEHRMQEKIANQKSVIYAVRNLFKTLIRKFSQFN